MESTLNHDSPAAPDGYLGITAAARSDHYGYKTKTECCELVVDPLAFLSLLAGVLGGTAFLNVAITMNITMRRRRRKRSSGVERDHGILEGRAGP